MCKCFTIKVFVLFTLELRPQIINMTQSVPVFIFKNKQATKLRKIYMINPLSIYIYYPNFS